MSLIVFALQRLSCPSMDSRFDSMHVQARIPVTRHAMLVHSRISLLGPVAHACHSHERSSRFFVMHVHRTHTSIRVSCISIGCFVFASFLVLQFLVVLRFLFQHPLSALTFALSYRCFPYEPISQQSVSEFTNIRYSPHGILALLVVFCFFAVRTRTPVSRPLAS